MPSMPQQRRQNAQTPSNIPTAGMEGLLFKIENFGSLNTKAKRPAIGDEEFSWLENYIQLGDGNMRSLPTNGTSIYTASGRTVVYFFPFNVGTTQYNAIFFNDGTAVQVNINTLSVTNIATVTNTFYNGGDLPDAAQWGNSGILIVSTANDNGYWAWDGTTLYSPGGASPAWLGGSGNTMPTGIHGTSVETYQGRVWIDNGSAKYYSAPTDGTRFGTNGGGSFTSSDSFLRHQFVSSKQSNGFLYTFGDSSINVISNVVTAGSPLATTFNNQNVDPQVGTAWPGTVHAFGRGLIFANPSGVYALYGGSAEKVSAQLDGLFANADFSTVTPTGAVATVYGIRLYILLVRATDYLGTPRNILCIWDGKKWFLGSQTKTITYTEVQEYNSIITAWGTDGTDVFQLFSTASSSLTKVLQTKLWAGVSYTVVKQILRIFQLIQDNSGSGVVLSGTLDYTSEMTSSTVAVTLTSATQAIIWKNNSNQTVTWLNNSAQSVVFTVTGLTVNGDNLSVSANLCGLTLTSTSSDFTLISLALGYRQQAPTGG